MTMNNEVAVVQRGNTLPERTEMRENLVAPSIDIYETPDAYVLVIDLPGVAKDAIKVATENGTMSVKAPVASYHKENAPLLFNELKTSTYYRVFNLADGIDRQTIEARFEHGVLTIKLFKKEETRAREIEVK